VEAQILGLGAFDSTNSAQIIEPSPGICAVMVGAGVTDVAGTPFRRPWNQERKLEGIIPQK